MLDWNCCIEDTVADWLSSVAIFCPPVDALKLAGLMGVEVVMHQSQEMRGRHKMISGRPVIVLQANGRAERLQWAAAHELGEVFGYQIYEKLSALLTGELPSREETANRIAKCLLLPFDWFQSQAELTDGDLFSMKSVFQTASHELIASRFLDLPALQYISIFDQGALTRRWSNGDICATQLHSAERRCWEAAHQCGEFVEHFSDGLRIRCWPIHEEKWKREIMQTISLGEIF